MSPSARGIARSGDLLWVADFSGAIVSITTAGVQKPFDVGGSPQEVGGGPDGQVLYANPGTMPQTIGRLVPGGIAVDDASGRRPTRSGSPSGRTAPTGSPSSRPATWRA